VLEGWQHSGHPVLFLPCFLPIKTGEHKSRGRTQQRREEKRREEKKEGENEKQKREKIGGEKERKNRGGRGRRKRSTAGHHSPLPQWQHPHRQHREQLVDVRLVTPTVTFLLRSPSDVHAACEKWRVIHYSFFFLRWVEPNPCIWAGFGPAHRTGPDPVQFKKEKILFLFLKFYDFFIFCYMFFCLISVCILFRKKYESGIKISGFRQNVQKYKKNWKKKKIFLCIRPSVSKLKNHIVFFIYYKKYFSMHFGFNN